jgi:MFS family permease
MGVNGTSTYTHRRAATGWVIALTGIGSLMAALDTLVVSTALSTIRLDLGASVQELEWTVNAYNLAFAVSLFFFAQLLQTVLGYGPLDAGLRLIPWTATFITVAPVVGALTDRLGERPFMVGGLLLQAAGLTWVALVARPEMTYSELVLPLVVAGVGVSMAIPSAQNSVVGSVRDEAVGKAAGANSMMRELGGVFGIALAVAVFAGAGSYASPAAFTDGFVPAIGVAAALSLAGALTGLALPGRRTAAPIVLAPRVALQAEEGGMR